MQIDLSAHGYRQAPSPGLWVPEGNDESEFAYNDGDAAEMWVGSAIRNATDVSTLSRELQREIKDWPSRYHLSPQRANLVRPLLDSMTGPVLEIGAGMGAITRALGEHGLDVIAIEGSPRRAAICADRCRDLDNVRVVADNFQSFGTSDKFSTIVMIGVLEYSRVFFDDGSGLDPVDAMLRHVASMLAPGGQFIIAIENQLGLKYLAGFPEDHVSRRMFGVEDRYSAESVVTFGREELRRRLSAVGLDQQEWFFPFPDYKLPTTVLSERAFADGSPFDSSPLVAPSSRNDHQHPGTIAFDIERAWHVVERNGLVPDLANSFLVRGSATPLPAASSATVAWYFGSGARRPEFSKTTTFELADGAMWVRRRPVLDGLPASIGSTRLALEDEPYHSGRPWTDALAEIVGHAGWDIDALAAWFGTWLVAFRSFASDSADDATTASADLVPGRLLDALPRNLVVGGESSEFIDLEWVSAESIPLAYAVFRALYDSLASRGPVAIPAEGTSLALRDLITEVAARHGIELDAASISRHWEREREFQSTVLGSPIEVTEDEALGACLSLHRDLDSLFADASAAIELRAQVARVSGEFEQASADVALLREEIDRRGAELDRRSDEIARRGADLDRARADQVELGRALGRLEREASTAHEDARQQIEKGRLQIASLESALRSAAAEVEALVAAQAAIKRTLSWRVTQPLRAVRSLPTRTSRTAPLTSSADVPAPTAAEAPTLDALPPSTASPTPDAAEEFESSTTGCATPTSSTSMTTVCTGTSSNTGGQRVGAGAQR
jgi:SAM-dependent methyltransferase